MSPLFPSLLPVVVLQVQVHCKFYQSNLRLTVPLDFYTEMCFLLVSTVFDIFFLYCDRTISKLTDAVRWQCRLVTGTVNGFIFLLQYILYNHFFQSKFTFTAAAVCLSRTCHVKVIDKRTFFP